MRFVLCSDNNWWGTHCAQTLWNPNFSVTIREIDIHESGSSKLVFIIVSSSRNDKRRSLLNSMQIVLMADNCVAPRGTLGITSSPFVCSWRHHHIPWSAVYEFQPHLFFALKTVSLYGVYSPRWVPCSSLVERPTKNSVLPQSQTEYFPNFHSIQTVEWRGGKMGNLLLGQPTYILVCSFMRHIVLKTDH